MALGGLGNLAAAQRLGQRMSGRPVSKYRGGPVSFKPGRNPLVHVGGFGHVTYPKGAIVAKPGAPGGGAASASTGASPPAGTASSGAASPLDAEYYQNVAENQFKTNNQINSLNLRQSNAGTSLQSQLAQLSHQQPLDELRLEQQANQRGALYSTPYGQQLGQLNYGYLGRQGAAQNSYGQLVASIASQIAGLRDAEQQYEMGQAESAAERGSLAAQKNPAAGESAGALVSPVAAVKASARAPVRRAPVRKAPARSKLAAAIAQGRRGGW